MRDSNEASQSEWVHFKRFNEYPLEGKSGASSRGNSSSKSVYLSCCSLRSNILPLRTLPVFFNIPSRPGDAASRHYLSVAFCAARSFFIHNDNFAMSAELKNMLAFLGYVFYLLTAYGLRKNYVYNVKI